ncbi:MAG: endonuclease domain-containing protein [Rhizobiaceae bacterium]
MPTVVEQTAIKRARTLRRAMTDGENKLWRELREFRRLYGIHVRSQVPIGPYVADFAVHSAKLVIEIDGEHHFTAEGRRRDEIRDAWFRKRGYTVLRFNTGEVSESFDGCVEEIIRKLGLMK